MTKVKTIQVKQGFGVFTVVALMLLAAKLFVGFNISYLTIAVVWLIPLWVVLGIVAIMFVIGIIALIISALLRK